MREKPFTPNEAEIEAGDVKLKLEKYTVAQRGIITLSPTLYSEVYEFLSELSYWGIQNESQTENKTEAREEASKASEKA